MWTLVDRPGGSVTFTSAAARAMQNRRCEQLVKLYEVGPRSVGGLHGRCMAILD